jgi:hypothetical protein
MEVENLLAPRRKKFKLAIQSRRTKRQKAERPAGVSAPRARGNLLNGSGGRRNLRLDSLILRYSHRARSNSRALKDTEHRIRAREAILLPIEFDTGELKKCTQFFLQPVWLFVYANLCTTGGAALGVRKLAAERFAFLLTACVCAKVRACT